MLDISTKYIMAPLRIEPISVCEKIMLIYYAGERLRLRQATKVQFFPTEKSMLLSAY